MNEDDVGKFFKDSEGNLWRMVIFCSRPTATLEKVGTKERVGGAVGCLNFSDFVKVEESVQRELSNLLHQINVNKFKSKRKL